jgi:hypothetical protein
MSPVNKCHTIVYFVFCISKIEKGGLYEVKDSEKVYEKEFISSVRK